MYIFLRVRVTHYHQIRENKTFLISNAPKLFANRTRLCFERVDTNNNSNNMCCINLQGGAVHACCHCSLKTNDNRYGLARHISATTDGGYRVGVIKTTGQRQRQNRGERRKYNLLKHARHKRFSRADRRLPEIIIFPTC